MFFCHGWLSDQSWSSLREDLALPTRFLDLLDHHRNTLTAARIHIVAISLEPVSRKAWHVHSLQMLLAYGQKHFAFSLYHCNALSTCFYAQLIRKPLRTFLDVLLPLGE